MAEVFDRISDKLATFIARQPVFFTATATADSRVNLSPKGMDSFRVLGPNQAAYLDLTGSGNETAAHLAHDGRITIMFCSFGRNALILRLYGRGQAVLPNDPRWADLIGLFAAIPGTRQIILIDVERVQTSCGYGVPEMTLNRERPTMVAWAEKKGEAGLADYRYKNNRSSIDGLPVETG